MAGRNALWRRWSRRYIAGGVAVAPVRKLRFMTMSEELSYYTGVVI